MRRGRVRWSMALPEEPCPFRPKTNGQEAGEDAPCHRESGKSKPGERWLHTQIEQQAGLVDGQV